MRRIVAIMGLGAVALVVGVVLDLDRAGSPTADAPSHGTRSAPSDVVVRNARPDEIAIVATEDPLMAAAFRKAQETLPDFLAVVRETRKSVTHMAVKIAVRDGGATEYFWIAPFAPSGTGFSGKINNTPRLVKTVRDGQTVAFAHADIVDWLYVEDGRMTGNFSACALLKGRSAEEIESFRRAYGLDCAS